jgi:hypothetical protein
VDSAGANIYIDTALRTIKIRNNSAAPKGPVLDQTGVTLQALYSFLKQEWKDDPNSKDLIAYPFPLIAITPEQFEFRFGWTPADDSSRSLIRTAGWREFAVDNSTLKRQYIGTISLGAIDGDQNQDGAGDQDFAYYGWFNPSTGAPVAGPFDFDFPGPVNQGVQVIDSSDYDYTTNVLRLFIRQPGKTYNQQDTTQIGLPAGSTLPYNTQRYPLVEGTDLNISVSDATIVAASGAGQKYSLLGDGPTIEYLAADEASNTFGYTQDLLGGPYNFGIKINSIDGTDGTSSLTNSELYSWVQYMLRQDSDIESASGSAKNGKLSDELLAYVGPTLTTKPATNLDQSGALTGTAILNINTSDINNTQLFNTGGSLQSFPFSAGITISFSDEILSDSATAKVFPYYSYTREYTGTSIAISNVAPSGSVYSADFVLTSFNPTPIVSVQNPEGLDPAGADIDKYFRITGAPTTGNNTIWKITAETDSSTFSAVTLDDDFTPANETISGGTLRTHPINSPGAILLDSAGESVENSGTVSTLASANLNASSQYVFSYAYDNNSQKDRLIGLSEGANVAITIRAIGLETGSWVETTGTIQKQDNNAFSVVSAVERNYSDPA